jgi:DnaJ family protein C protein 7
MSKPEEARYAFEEARRNGTEFDVDEKVRQCQEEEKRARKKDHYKTLGLTNKATDDEIKSSYKKLALMYHPDKQRNKTEKEKKDNEAKFKEIATAYSVLINPEKRKRYDMGIDDDDMSGGFSNINPMDIFGSLFGQGGGFSDGFGDGGHNAGHTFFSFGAPGGFNNSKFSFKF